MEHAPQTVLITGGAGFVMSNVARALLQASSDTRVIVLDRYRGDHLLETFLAEFGERAVRVFGDILDPQVLAGIGERYAPTHVVHGAAITHQALLEAEKPTLYVDVNLIGTVRLLEWARRVPGLVRFVYVSTGGVYGSPTPWSTVEPQGEDGPFDPPELYAVTKYAAELIVRRYKTIFGMDCIRVRLSDVFGPMERATGARTSVSLPYRMVRSVIERRPLRVSRRSLDAPMDMVGAVDVAQAVALVLSKPQLVQDTYNIAAGAHIRGNALFGTFASAVPGFRFEIVDDGAEVDMDPSNTLARFNAYDIARISALGWQPQKLSKQLDSYFAWVIADPEVRCPAI